MERFVAPTSWVAIHGAKIATRTKMATMAIPIMARRLIDDFQLPIADCRFSFLLPQPLDQLAGRSQQELLCQDRQLEIMRLLSWDPANDRSCPSTYSR